MKKEKEKHEGEQGKYEESDEGRTTSSLHDALDE